MVYLDNGATTPVDPAVVGAMLPFFTEDFGNPSSLHRLGARAARALSDARETFASALGVDPAEIVFTGGGTEADNIGVRGAAMSASPKQRHALLLSIEHPAVLEQSAFLESLGFQVELIPVDAGGVADMAAFERLVRPGVTSVVGVMHANNEIGTLQPIDAMGELLSDVCPEAHFHVDAVQSFTKAPVRPRQMRATTVAFAAHKLHGPKGVGALYVKKGARLRPLVVGGGQERKVRPGTENVPGIAGFAKAVELGMSDLAGDAREMARLRDLLFERILTSIDRVGVNGDRVQRLCNNVNVNIEGARAEVLLHALEERGIYVSSGSACHAGATGPSHVLRAIGRTEKDTGSLRITLSRRTTEAEVLACAAALAEVVPKARA